MKVPPSARRHVPAAIILLLLALLFFSNLPEVPFHPDETSLLYQSRDLEAYAQNPWALAFRPPEPPRLQSTYRALNAPLPKYVLGLGRRIAGFGAGAVSTDWNWSESWSENLAAGAYPPTGALHGARAASTLLALAGALCLSLIGARMKEGRHLSWLLPVLYGTNALVLLHGRRAMAEGTLLFGVSFALLALPLAHKRPALAGVAMAVAANSKHSALPLAAIGWVAASGLLHPDSVPIRRRVRMMAEFTAVFLLTTAVLNPFLWRHPLRGAAEIFASRQAFVQDQMALTAVLSPERLLRSPAERLASLLGHLFVGPLQFQEVGNYGEALEPSFAAYRAGWLHTASRGPLAGGLLLILVILGFIVWLRHWDPVGEPPHATVSLLAAATLVEAVALLALNPLPIQRYYLPLVPLIVFWQGLGISSVASVVQQGLLGARSS